MKRADWMTDADWTAECIFKDYAPDLSYPFLTTDNWQSMLKNMLKEAYERGKTRGGDTQMSKHTPGPWEIGPGRGDVLLDEYEIQPANGRGPIALASGLDDARLIAAAPDLLEALRNWLDAHEEFFTADDDDIMAGLKLHESYERARAAIAKAEGRS